MPFTIPNTENSSILFFYFIIFFKLAPFLLLLGHKITKQAYTMPANQQKQRMNAINLCQRLQLTPTCLVCINFVPV